MSRLRAAFMSSSRWTRSLLVDTTSGVRALGRHRGTPTITDPQTGKTSVLQQGDTLRDSTALGEIGDGYAVLRDGDRIERLTL